MRALLAVVGPRLERLTVECDEEQGNGSEIVHLARHCPNITSLRILLGDKVLRGEMTLHFGQVRSRKDISSTSLLRRFSGGWSG